MIHLGRYFLSSTNTQRRWSKPLYNKILYTSCISFPTESAFVNHLFQHLLIDRKFTTTPFCLSTIPSYFHHSFPSLTCTHLSGYLVMSLELVRHGIIICIFHHDIHTSARLHDSEAIPTHARSSLIDVSDALCILFPQVWSAMVRNGPQEPAMVRNSPQWHLGNPFSLFFFFFTLLNGSLWALDLENAKTTELFASQTPRKLLEPNHYASPYLFEDPPF